MSKNQRVIESVRDGYRGLQTTRGVCPFCVDNGHATRKKNLSLDRATGRWFCFRCHKVGRLDGWEPDEQALISARTRGITIPTFDPPPGWYEIGQSSTTSAAYSYVKSRKITDAAIREARMGISTLKPEDADQDFRNRIIVPILAADKETWLGYVGRTLRRSGLTYMYKRGMFRGKILYNQAELYRRTDEPLLVVEGTLDVAFLWPNAVATLGTWSEDQYILLQEAARPVVVVLDGDAWRKGEALAMKLKIAGVRAGHVRLPPTKDPDDVDPSWLRQSVLRAL